MLHQRASGLLLHITSLPSGHGIGDLGPEAYHFADFLAASGQTYWQILPLTPIDPGAGFSPYSSPSAFAGNPLLISLDKLADDGLLPPDVVERARQPDSHWADFWAVWQLKWPLLNRAAQTFRHEADPGQRADYDKFTLKNQHWLNDYALFTALQQDTGIYAWVQWSAELVQRQPDAIGREIDRLRDAIETIRVLQYLFYRQWQELVSYCFARKIHLIGDIPIYVQYNSADVWSFQELFKLDERGLPTHVAGSPPDYFSADGQRWGNPVYDWPRHAESDFQWWARRLRHQMALYSLTRLDNFLGFAEYWEIPAHEQTARQGQWKVAPVEEFMRAMYRQFVQLPIVAEDLGAKAAEVQPVLQHYGIPGMRLVQFGFGPDSPTSAHTPHSYIENVVAYTGTHDNNTTRGWFRNLNESDRSRLAAYTGLKPDDETVTEQLIRLTLQSVARLTIFPVQDILNLDEAHRMNTPGGSGADWTWRLLPAQLQPAVAERLRLMTTVTGRIS